MQHAVKWELQLLSLSPAAAPAIVSPAAAPAVVSPEDGVHFPNNNSMKFCLML